MLAAKFRAVGEIEKHHEERYRTLLKNIETAQVFEKSEVKVWECRNCVHIVVARKQFVHSRVLHDLILMFGHSNQCRQVGGE